MRNFYKKAAFLNKMVLGLMISTPLYAYNFTDDQPHSETPPAGISSNQAPLFVSIGFDDNSVSGIAGSGGTGGMTWILDYLRNKKNRAGKGNSLIYDSSPVRVSFFNASKYQEQENSDDPVFVKRAWNTAFNDGHEIGIHTVNHLHGSTFNLTQWDSEIKDTITHLSKPFNPDEQPGNSQQSSGMGADSSKLSGFRTPFLEYNDETFDVLVQQGFIYDTSIEEGWEDTMDGSNYPWPYTLDSGSPGNQYMLDNGFPNKVPLTPRPGLWELGVNPVIIPPDNLTAQYGVNHSIRNKVKSNISEFDVGSGKITGFDFNLWDQAKLNKAETLATLKYTLDLRLQNGNRAPFMFGAHSEYYSSKGESFFSQISVRDRQEVIEEFITYALSKPEVRIVPYISIINWMRNPSAIDCGSDCPTTMLPPVVNNVENQSNKVDSLIELTIQATDPNGLSLKYTAENLPEGLSIDPLSGLISGIVSEESNNAVTIKVDNGELNRSINFNWQITADPWESINVIENRLFALVKHNKDLHTRHFQGRRWNQRWLNKKSISGYLSKARYDCLRGRPKKAISKLEALLRSLDQKMLVGSERKLLKQKVNEEIPHLTALINEKF